MKRRDLAWLVVVLVAAAVWIKGQRPASTPTPTGEFQLKLVLAAEAQFQNTFTLTLKSTPQGAGHDTFLQVPGVPPPWDTHGGMNRETFEKLRANLEQAGIWTVPSADADDPEEQVLYTRLTVSQGERRYTSEWRGIPGESHKQLVGCFLDSCLGKTIDSGLRELLKYKRRSQR